MTLPLPSSLMENANGAIPYSAFHFRLEMVKPAFVTCHNTEQKIIAFVSIYLQQFGGDGFSPTFVVFGQ